VRLRGGAGTATAELVTIDPATGSVAVRGATVDRLDAIAFACTSAADRHPDDESDRRPTAERRLQRERTNRAGFDDYRIEGDVLATRCEAAPPEVTIGNRDGEVTVRLLHEAAAPCRSIRPGWYLEAEGEKQHEFLFDAHDISISRERTRTR